MADIPKETTFIIRNTCDKYEEEWWHWRLQVVVEPFLQGSIKSVVYAPRKNDGVKFELFRSKEDNCLFRSNITNKAWGTYTLKVTINLDAQGEICFDTEDAGKKYKIKLRHELDFKDIGTPHTTLHKAAIIHIPTAISPEQQEGCQEQSEPEKTLVNVTISNNCESKDEHYWYWRLFVKMDEALHHRVERVRIKSLYIGSSGRKHDLIPSDTDPFTYTTAKLRHAWGTYDLSVRLYLKKDVNVLHLGEQERTRIELLHDLDFGKKMIRDGSLHSTHHSGVLLIETPADETITASSVKPAVAPPPPPAEAKTTTAAPPSTIPPSRWCITYDQLMDVEKKAIKKFGKIDYPNKTMRDICNAIIEPTCTKTRTSYALHLNQEGLEVDVFISHGWDGQFSSFVQSIRTAFQTVMAKPNLWICAFALVQGQNEELISKQVGSSDDPLEESPFVRAIKSASTYCVVRNSNMDIYGRIWCVCELIYANHYGLFPKRTHVTGPDFFAHKKSSVLDAQASRLQDRDRILKVLLTEFDRGEIDGIVHQLRIQSTPQEDTTIA